MSDNEWRILAGTVITPTRIIQPCRIDIKDKKILRVISAVDISSSESQIELGELDLNALDGYVIPGLVDLQVNGALGWSFQAVDQPYWQQICNFHLHAGTTSFLPTLVSAPRDVLLTSLLSLADCLDSIVAPYLPGIHLEGPFLSPERSGAHDPAALHLPDTAYFSQLINAARSKVRMITLAPELPGSEDLIRCASQAGILVSAGHTTARYSRIQDAVRAGLRFITHAGNASDWPHREMGEHGFLVSEPGLVGSLMAIPDLGGSVIMDGFHFHPALFEPMIRIKSPKNLVLISDSSPVAGSPPGDYKSGGLEITIHPDGFATSGRGGGWLAGSTITLLEGVQRAVQLAKIPLQQAVMMATVTPARWIGISPQKGQIRSGGDADLLILNRDLSLRHVIAGGQIIQ